MRKNLNKLATLALSGMMVMSMAMPAFAAQNFEAPVLKKVVYTDGNTHAPNTTFKFDVKWDSTTKKFTEGGVENTLGEVAEANRNNVAVKVADIKFTPTANDLGTPIAGGSVFRSEAAITVDTTKFPGEGYYLFDLKEVEGNYQGIRYDKNNYKLFVIIYKDATGALKSKVSVYRADANKVATTKTEYIGNNYGRENTPPPSPELPPITPDENDEDTHDVTIKKKVTGSMGDSNKEFNFEIKITSDRSGKVNPDNDHEFYKVTGEGITTPTSIESDTAAKVFKLRDKGEGIRIFGLSNGDKIEVKESNGASYTMTVKEDTTGKVSAVKDGDGFFTVADYTTNFYALKNEASVTVTNNKDAITPTGIVMNVAPYAMMLAVAGGLGVVFMNRKKEEE